MCIDGDHLVVNVPLKWMAVVVVTMVLIWVYGDAFSFGLVPVFPHSWKIDAVNAVQSTPSRSFCKISVSLTATDWLVFWFFFFLCKGSASERPIARTRLHAVLWNSIAIYARTNDLSLLMMSKFVQFLFLSFCVFLIMRSLVPFHVVFSHLFNN